MTVYMDNSATSRIQKSVLDEMLPYLSEEFGNPSSLYEAGLHAKKAMQTAREKIAKLLNCEMNEIYITSGGTEADNWAIKGYLFANQNKGKHIITSAIEHPAVLRTCEFMKKSGYRVTVLQPDENGYITAENVETAITPDTAFITIQYANNEIGTIQPIAEIAEVATKHGIAFHTDAVQAVGTIPINLKGIPVTMLSASAHKFGGPKGIGFLYVKDGTELESLLHGGPQEKRMRAGTENVPSIIGMAKALELSLEEEYAEVKRIRDHMEKRILKEIPDVKINGGTDLEENAAGSEISSPRRLPGNLNVSFADVEATALLVYLDLAGIAVSGGSACSSAENKPSEVLKAIGVCEPYLSGSVRFSLGTDNTMEEANYVVDRLVETVRKLRH